MWRPFKRKLWSKKAELEKAPSISAVTEQQIAAIQADLKPTLVIAGAGSGKTFVLAKRFEYLINEMGLDPQRILVVTFTRKATTNMKHRITGYLPPEIRDSKDLNEQINIRTFHQFARRFLLEEDGKASIVYEEKAKGIAVDIINRLELKMTAKTAAWEIIMKLRWMCKRDGVDFTRDDLIRQAIDISNCKIEMALEKFPEEDMRRLYQEFDDELLRKNWFTFDDLLLYTFMRLKIAPIRNKWSSRYDAILVDEFQDIDEVQFEILKSLSTTKENIFAVGDPDQSIYGFRGAMSRIFDSFKDHFGNRTQIFKLEENFRSTPEILNVANTLINAQQQSSDFRKELFTSRPSGMKPMFFKTDKPELEDEWIVDKILELNSQGINFDDIAILSRNHKHSQTIRNKLLAKRIPYYYEQEQLIHHKKAEIRDLLAWLTISVVDKESTHYIKAIVRVINKPARGIGDKALKPIKEAETAEAALHALLNSENIYIRQFNRMCDQIREVASSRDISLPEKVDKVMNMSGMDMVYEKDPDKLQRIRDYAKNIVDQSGSLEDFGHKVSEGMNVSLDEDNVFVSTIHGAKGLEFKHLFVMRFDEGFLPSTTGIKKAEILGGDRPEENIAEERRLSYVAITRAQDSLYISSCKNPSRFVEDISHLLVDASQ